MIFFHKTAFFVILIILSGFFHIKAQQTDSVQNVVLIGWDGAQRNHLEESMGNGELPNIKALITDGSYVVIEIYGTTDTKAGWSQILTGYDPEITGIYSNQSFNAIPAGYTIFERIKQFYGKSFITLAVIGKKGHLDTNATRLQIIPNQIHYKIDSVKKIKAEDRSISQKETLRKFNQKYNSAKIYVKNDSVFAFFPGDPYHYSKNGCDTFINGLKENKLVAKEACRLIRKYRHQRFFIFVHFAEIDAKGHDFGENSKQYNDAMISCDKYSGVIIKKLKKLGLYRKTMVYITADHGFDEGLKNHKNAPHVFLASNDKNLKKQGTRADITPTILARLGIDLKKIFPALSGHSLITN